MEIIKHTFIRKITLVNMYKVLRIPTKCSASICLECYSFVGEESKTQ